MFFFVALFKPQFLELHPGQRLKDQKSTLAEEKKFTKDEFSFAEVLAIVGGRTRNTLIILHEMNLYRHQDIFFS